MQSRKMDVADWYEHSGHYRTNIETYVFQGGLSEEWRRDRCLRADTWTSQSTWENVVFEVRLGRAERCAKQSRKRAAHKGQYFIAFRLIISWRPPGLQ